MNPQGDIRPLKPDEEPRPDEVELGALEQRLVELVHKEDRWQLLKKIRRLGDRVARAQVLKCKGCGRPMVTVQKRLIAGGTCSTCLSRAKAGQPLRPLVQDISPRQRRKAAIREVRRRHRMAR